jgi:hypothetical protein
VSVYRHISAERAHCDHPVSLMCELLEVSESGYWAWCKRAPSDRQLADAWLTERIRAIQAGSGGRYGSPRVHAMLRREGIFVGEKRVERLMRAAGLQGAHRRRRKGCTIPVPGVEPFADLVGGNFRPAAPNLVWASRGGRHAIPTAAGLRRAAPLARDHFQLPPRSPAAQQGSSISAGPADRRGDHRRDARRRGRS